MERRLVTIGISHYCEKARWALDRAGLAYTELACAPITHAWHARRGIGQRSTPVLFDGDRVIGDSTEIFDHVQAHPAARWRPWPEGPAGEEARRWEATFDDELGPHVRRVAYFHLLPERALTTSIVRSRSTPRQGRLFSAGYPLWRRVIARSLRIDAAGVERSTARVEAVLARVEAHLADGRPWLAGDRFSAADLTFAALAAVTVLPPRYLAVDLDALPAALREIVRSARERPAGRFAWRVWERERG